ncbi:unnamed protein product [Sphagnum jensenii]|uniref:Fe2OG dioxygenase domain-containing protein n=1 Tax=Sphagnum jensenii TaxID=128206 RepID=A0ABP1AJX4_9BRYO
MASSLAAVQKQKNAPSHHDDDHHDDKVTNKNISSSSSNNKKKKEEEEEEDLVCDVSEMTITNDVDDDDNNNNKSNNPFDVTTRSMGRYLRGEMTVEEFFLPEKVRGLYYLPHDQYQEDDEMPVFDLSGILQQSVEQSSNGVEVVHDAAEAKQKEAAEDLICRMMGEASRTWGFFGVVNHGVSLELIERMRAQAQLFFQLPVHQKLKGAPNERLPLAYFPGTPSFHYSKCWNEALQLESNPDKLQLFCESVWSEEHDRESFRAALLECTAALGELGGRILVLLAKSLGLDPNQFKRHLRFESKASLRMNHYPPCPHPDKIEGLYAHTDASMISIVHQGLVGGLQILKDDKWVGVRPNPAALVVNIGEAVMMMSNERFSSVMHRVVANSHEPRLSLAFFCMPGDEDVISVAEKLTNESHPAKFIPFSWKEYIAHIWREDRPGYYRKMKGSSSTDKEDDDQGSSVNEDNNHDRQSLATTELHD